ncbi:hypothetical protein MNB_SM-7-1229 [hydrothermal vent metagenome]|uniref:Resolvase/invertase-type recombinase catalytic domain-containing protein n=1 Tax=hydrothermal vent metagenome TaxID=652676 RepID=A0A1W1BFG9_9ZZZZ
MAIAYIRPDKNFGTAYDQLKFITSYALLNKMQITRKFIDHTPKNNRSLEEFEATKFFRSHQGETLLVADIWVFGGDVEEITQAFNCLFKNDITIHFVTKSVVMSKRSSAVFVLGLLDEARRMLQKSSQKRVGRPKGSRSSSKFDIYLERIISYIQEEKSVSEIARLLGVSRSSLKDYIESRELKKLAQEPLIFEKRSEEDVINMAQCPDEAYEMSQQSNKGASA